MVACEPALGREAAEEETAMSDSTLAASGTGLADARLDEVELVEEGVALRLPLADETTASEFDTDRLERCCCDGSSFASELIDGKATESAEALSCASGMTCSSSGSVVLTTPQSC